MVPWIFATTYQEDIDVRSCCKVYLWLDYTEDHLLLVGGS